MAASLGELFSCAVRILQKSTTTLSGPFSFRQFHASGCYFCKSQGEEKNKKKAPVFRDSLRIHVKGGTGGHGFEKYGGLGGQGGNIFMLADEKTSFEDILKKNPKKRFAGGVGQSSGRKVLLGAGGHDLQIKVPVGVCVKNDEGQMLGDLNEHGQRILVCSGGEGGNHTNNYNGQKGENTNLTLDLKLIADVGLVGFPNAGKSTFLSAISKAKPKIGAYPFTTIRPQVGIMEYPDLRQISIADLPGLIEGAHFNFGMGHKFLKHIERTKLLLFMVDVNGFQLKLNYKLRTAFEMIILLNKELELYDASVLNKPAILALNKIDVPEADEKAREVINSLESLPDSLETLDAAMRPEKLINFHQILTISSKMRLKTDDLKDEIRRTLDYYDDLKRTENLDKTSSNQNSLSFQITRQREKARNKLV